MEGGFAFFERSILVFSKQTVPTSSTEMPLITIERGTWSKRTSVWEEEEGKPFFFYYSIILSSTTRRTRTESYVVGGRSTTDTPRGRRRPGENIQPGFHVLPSGERPQRDSLLFPKPSEQKRTLKTINSGMKRELKTWKYVVQERRKKELPFFFAMSLRPVKEEYIPSV